MINKIFRFSLIFLFFTIILSCDKDEDNANNPPDNPQEISGCTNEDALNYNLEATIDDGSCIILGCTDESATNYNPEATDDDNSCEYSIASMLDGTWNIILLDYETEIDLSFLSELVGVPLGNEEISGQAQDAGIWTLNSGDYTYSSELDFETEEFTLAAVIPVPSLPFEDSSTGTWELTNNETDLNLTDEGTGEQSEYEIISISENNAFVVGTISRSQEIMGFSFDLVLDLQMQLEKEPVL